MKTDEGKLIDIEMQNSALTKEVHYRFQIYGARMIDHQVNRGDLLYSENVHEVYTILFVNDIDRDNLLLIDTYMPRNQLNHVRKYNLLTHHNIYLPFIDAVVREKGLKNLSKIELAIYTLYHGITDDIMALNSEVVIMMKEKMDQFNEDEELVLAASKRQLVKIQHHQEKVRIRQEGKEEGELLKAKEKTLKLFNKRFPDENNELLENLALLQYDQIFDALLENEDLKTIKKIEKGYQVEAKVKYPNDTRIVKQEVIFDKKLKPLIVLCLDQDETEIVTCKVNEFHKNKNFKEKHFNQNQALKESKKDVKTSANNDVLYPVSLLGAKLESETVSSIEGDKNHILKFSGDKSFTMVETQVNDQQVMQFSNDEVIDLIDGFAYYQPGKLSMMYHGMMCSLYSQDLTKEEMLSVMTSMQTSSTK